jgi:hypothetical protein
MKTQTRFRLGSAAIFSAFVLSSCASSTLLDDKQRERVTSHGEAVVASVTACLTNISEKKGRTVKPSLLEATGATRLEIISGRSSQIPRRFHAHEPTTIATIDIIPVTPRSATVVMTTPPVLVHFRDLPVSLRKDLSGCGVPVSA